jgi:hypothetical protein
VPVTAGDEVIVGWSPEDGVVVSAEAEERVVAHA